MVNYTVHVGYIPTQEAAAWCIEQQLTHWNNLELYLVMLPVGAFLVLTTEEWLRGLGLAPKLHVHLRLWARVLLLLFFLGYFIATQWRLF